MEQLLHYKAFIIVTWFLLIFAAERMYQASAYPKKLSSRLLRLRLAKNISFSAINSVLSPLLIIPLTIILAGSIDSWRPPWMDYPLFFLVDLLILDGFSYIWHRLNHRLPFLWSFHQVHHLDEFLDSSSALRFHFGEVFLSALFRVLVISLFAIPLSSVIVFEVVLMVCVIFHHSNLKLPHQVEYPLSLLIVTPSLHWVHHHPRQKDTDSNYASIFSFWDRLFNSRNRQCRWQDMPIGVEQRHELPLLALLLEPFRALKDLALAKNK